MQIIEAAKIEKRTSQKIIVLAIVYVIFSFNFYIVIWNTWRRSILVLRTVPFSGSNDNLAKDAQVMILEKLVLHS